MQNASSAGRKLTNEERVEVVKRQKKRNSFQLAMLSVIGILGFLLLWQAAVLAGVLPSRYWQLSSEFLWGFLWAGSGDSTNLCGPSLKFCGPYRRFPGFR